MGHPVISTQEVRQAGTNGRLVLPQGAIVTAAAADLAADMGVTLAHQDESFASPAAGEDALAAQVRSIVASLLDRDGSGTSTAAPGRRPVKLVLQRDAQTQPFVHEASDPNQLVETGDVITTRDGAPMAAGYMTLTKGSFPWTLNYDEIQIVLEGELHIGTPEGTRIAHAGDIVYVPKGNSITFGTPSWTKFVYVTYPADWENQG